MEEIVKSIYTTNFNLFHSVNVDNKRINIHFHEDFEVFFLIKGASHCLIDDKVVSVKPYDLIFFYPNTIHRMIRNEETIYERFIVQTKMSFLNEIQENGELTRLINLSKLTGKTIITLSDEDRGNLINFLTECSKLDIKNMMQTLIKAKFTEIMCLICSFLLKYSNPETRIIQIGKIEPILRYINQCYTNPNCDLSKIAQGCHMSKFYLCEVFKKYTTMTVNTYLISKRVSHAKALLKSGMNVTECAAASGFSDCSNFIRVFKRYEKITPKQYQLSLDK